MEDWQRQLLAERDDVENKTTKLMAFINTHRALVSADEYSRLLTQLHIMRAYSTILNSRILAW